MQHAGCFPTDWQYGRNSPGASGSLARSLQSIPVPRAMARQHWGLLYSLSGQRYPDPGGGSRFIVGVAMAAAMRAVVMTVEKYIVDVFFF